ncbi:MAG: Amidase enhancer [Candidatus Dichloromethanomonas elyunquensis]|nr:MAG: Amidase enhancer [Candidatus Dichloromethanomonas elyunquensis]
MKLHLKKTTASIMAVILLVGIFPYFLSKYFEINSEKQGIHVRLSLSSGQIRTLPLEEYLIGVLAAEMPAEFEMEALKAQAVASRTYVLKRMENRTTEQTYDVDTTEKTQAWISNQEIFRKWGIINYFKYHRKMVQAVEATSGKILTYNGQKIDAVYYSSCGRKSTERASDVWGTETNYLTNGPSGEENPSRFVKHQVYEVEPFYKALGFNQIPLELTEKDIVILQRTKAGRVKTLKIRNKVFEATDFRTRLQLPSTDFEYRIQGKKIEIITYGKGHAVGMSQYGANDLAKSGKDYTEILRHYYQDTKIEKVYG